MEKIIVNIKNIMYLRHKQIYILIMTKESLLKELDQTLTMALDRNNKSIRQYLRRRTTTLITSFIQKLDESEDPNQIKLPLNEKDHGKTKS